jgi:hypothetical protein
MASYEPIDTVANCQYGKTRTSYRARRSADATTCLASSYAAVAATRTSYENSRGYYGYGDYYGYGCKRHCSRGTCKRQWQSHCLVLPCLTAGKKRSPFV